MSSLLKDQSMSKEEGMVESAAEALMMARHPDAPLTYSEVVYAVQTGSDPTVLEGLRRNAVAVIEAARPYIEDDAMEKAAKAAGYYLMARTSLSVFDIVELKEKIRSLRHSDRPQSENDLSRGETEGLDGGHHKSLQEGDR